MKLILSITLLLSLTSTFSGGKNWYICSSCCKTKNADTTPWENGCRKSSSGMHSFDVSGIAGDYSYTFRKCDAEVYLTSSQGPGASKCCATGTTHDWYHE
jgi:hypothetical protein